MVQQKQLENQVTMGSLEKEVGLENEAGLENEVSLWSKLVYYRERYRFIKSRLKA